jgi:co-chaperonin GroES (HSP10)
MPKLHALPGKVILRFPVAAEKSEGGLFIPETSQLRPEFGELESIGEPLNDAQKRIAASIIERAAAGQKFVTTYAAGTPIYNETMRAHKELSWMKAYRGYAIEQLAVTVEGVE